MLLIIKKEEEEEEEEEEEACFMYVSCYPGLDCQMPAR